MRSEWFSYVAIDGRAPINLLDGHCQGTQGTLVPSSEARVPQPAQTPLALDELVFRFDGGKRVKQDNPAIYRGTTEGVRMKRTNTFALAPTEKQHWRLFEIANVCARLWNELNYRRRQSFFKGKLNWESRDLYDKYKSVVGSATAQQVQRKNNEGWRSFLLCLSSKRKANSRPHPKGQTAPLLERQGKRGTKTADSHALRLLQARSGTRRMGRLYERTCAEDSTSGPFESSSRTRSARCYSTDCRRLR